MAIGLVLSALGLGGLCFLLVRSTIYALPVFAGFVAGFWANGTGAGPIGVPSDICQHVFALGGAGAIGVAAIARLIDPESTSAIKSHQQPS
jgi:hypothetical protein